MNFLEIGHAIASDLGVLLQQDYDLDAGEFPVDSPEGLLDLGCAGQTFCDKLLKDCASTRTSTNEEASTIVRPNPDQCMYALVGIRCDNFDEIT